MERSVRKKILIVNFSFFHVSETFIYNQILGLQKDFDVELCGSDFLNEATFPLPNIRKFRFKRLYKYFDRGIAYLLKKVWSLDSAFNPIAYLKIFLTLLRGKYDLVHAQYGWAATFDIPPVRLSNTPIIVTFHGKDASGSPSNRRYRKRLNELFDHSRQIIVVSQHMIASLNLERRKDKISIVPCGVDNRFFKSRPAVKSDTIKILHSGRVVPKKEVPDLIKVFAQILEEKEHKNIELDILGDGEELAESKSMAVSLGVIGKVSFYRSKRRSYVKELMSSGDIFVLNSRTDKEGDMEGTPTSILEVMSMGLVVVSTKHAGIPHVIDGIVVEETNNSQLKEAIVELLPCSALRKELGMNAVKKISSRFTVDHMNSAMRDIVAESIY